MIDVHASVPLGQVPRARWAATRFRVAHLAEQYFRGPPLPAPRYTAWQDRTAPIPPGTTCRSGEQHRQGQRRGRHEPLAPRSVIAAVGVQMPRVLTIVAGQAGPAC
ncbi:hypothetical protein [Amycolatopsis sp.]|uniref:hypothetical protein n=1 Tax=Amycolatopsis sp. TaxID=37632 RepID=UPI003BB98E60